MVSDDECLRLHVEAEFIHDAHGRLVRVNEPGGGAAPRFWLGQAPDGTVVSRFRHDLPEALRETLQAAAAPNQLPAYATGVALDPAPFATILARSAPVTGIGTGLAFRFGATLPAAAGARRLHPDDAACLRPLLPAWVPDLTHSQPVLAVLVAGEAVAVCASVRITARAHEAGVETAPAWRGRGYAAAAVRGWAAQVRASGAEPLYSTTTQNAASRALARKLGLLGVGRDLRVT